MWSPGTTEPLRYSLGTISIMERQWICGLQDAFLQSCLPIKFCFLVHLILISSARYLTYVGHRRNRIGQKLSACQTICRLMILKLQILEL